MAPLVFYIYIYIYIFFLKFYFFYRLSSFLILIYSQPLYFFLYQNHLNIDLFTLMAVYYIALDVWRPLLAQDWNLA